MPSISTVISSTSTADADRMLARLGRQKDAWTRVPIEERAQLLRDCLGRLLDVAEEWVERACKAKQVALDSPWAGEEWISGPMVTVRYVRLLAEALQADGRPGNAAFRVGTSGQTIARVFPTNAIDRILYPGVTADVWIEKNKLPTQGRIYRDKRDGQLAPGRVALVLGAGNVGSIPPTDLLYKMFVEDQVVLVKMNPVNEYLGPLLERVFEPLCKRGWLAFAYGGADVGAYLCAHDGVDTLHLTGSDRTYDAIVWGADEAERRRRKAAGTPRVDKPFTAELGCVTPVIVTPGRWTSAEIEFQARNVASMVAHNASFNCTAAKVLVLPEAWRQGAEFVDAVKAALRGIPPRHPYYPGARAIRRLRRSLPSVGRAVGRHRTPALDVHPRRTRAGRRVRVRARGVLRSTGGGAPGSRPHG